MFAVIHETVLRL